MPKDTDVWGDLTAEELGELDELAIACPKRQDIRVPEAEAIKKAERGNAVSAFTTDGDVIWVAKRRSK